MRLTVMRQNEKDESTKSVRLHLFLCLCVLCTFVHRPGISHPAAYQSRPLCSSVCIKFVPSVFHPRTDPCLSWTEGGPLAF